MPAGGVAVTILRRVAVLRPGAFLYVLARTRHDPETSRVEVLIVSSSQGVVRWRQTDG